ncbi:MAG: protein phosphatase 2C domain-containing protein [Nanoarchaeota archaeon]|nr:protein phosphatase 2C domain-containing protein [Nanoarchaeota archaeon]
MDYEVICRSEKGKDKEINEDALTYDLEKNIFIVADGMGGHNSAYTASHQATEFMYGELIELYDRLRQGEITEDRIPRQLERSIKRCNDFICAPTRMLEVMDQFNSMQRRLLRAYESLTPLPQGADDGKEKVRSALDVCEAMASMPLGTLESLRNMGTTLDATIIFNGTAYIGHVGNGRVYNIRRHTHLSSGYMEQLTTEHVDYPPGADRLTRDQKTVLEMRLGLNSFIGKTGELKVDVVTERLGPADTFVIVTDGVSHTVSYNELSHIMSGKWEYASDELMKLIQEPEQMAPIIADGQMSNSEVREKFGGRDDATFLAIRRLR